MHLNCIAYFDIAAFVNVTDSCFVGFVITQGLFSFDSNIHNSDICMCME